MEVHFLDLIQPLFIFREMLNHFKKKINFAFCLFPLLIFSGIRTSCSCVFYFFFPAILSVAVTPVDQCWDLLYLLHISSAVPFSPLPHLFSAFLFFFFFFYIHTSDNAAALSLFTVRIKAARDKAAPLTEHGSARVTARHTSTSAHGVCMCVYEHDSRVTCVRRQ